LPPLDTPGWFGRRNCNVNLDDLRWDRPELDCEPQQVRGIRRNLQLDETALVVVRWRAVAKEEEGGVREVCGRAARG